MPRGDGTGPMGLGPMTGRAAGYCAGYPVPGFMNPIRGRGFWGGGGRGRRNWFYATGLPGWARAGYLPAWGQPPLPYAAPFGGQITREQELDTLKAQAESLRSTLDAISKRIEELETAAETK